jgi:hypothetical protein
MKWCLQLHTAEWDAVVDRALKDWRGKSFQAMICKFALGYVIYNSRMLRNDIKLGNFLL